MRTAAVVLALSLISAAAAESQELSLNQIDSLVALGQVHEARDGLQSWWASTGPTAARQDLQRGLWLRAILTVDPALAEADFQRLVLEFPGGPYSDRALLRLGYGAHARNDLVAAAERFRAILRDYPDSPLRTVSQTWLDTYGTEADAQASAAAAEEQRPQAAEPEEPPPEAPREPPGTPPERREQPAPQVQPTREPVVERPQPPAEATPTTPTTPAGQGTFAIQLGAFSQLAGARRVAERAQAAGFEARLVRTGSSPLIRVRIGRFPDEAEANRQLAAVTGAGLEAILVDNADRESPVR